MWKNEDMETAAMTVCRMEDSMRAKLLKVKAISEDDAVTIREANFDMQELNWLDYVAGGLFAEIKKTADRRYYVTVIK
jgi:hypothetical protein